ncbi:MAG: large conductance mechanosensitive channel protein MscL [Bacteroidetes bacterium]|nr:large conductance mechanosensitive channel protein MscL [Bacteroidota bacterium]
MFAQLKAFLMRGNVLDLAVGVIIGAAFGKIVSALVDSIIMPLVGGILGGVNFTTLSFQIAGISVGYGAFLQAVVDFILVGTSLFLLLRVAGPSAVTPAPTPSEALLAEIRDLLKKDQEK